MSGEALTFVEIDIAYCALSYGVAPCQASLTDSPATDVARCFNSFPTCQDSANFTEETKTLRFAVATAHLPRDIDIIGPWVISVDYSPSTVSLGENLGQRASVKISFTEHRHSDAGDGLDKYHQERISGAAQASGIGYDPYQQGTFWARLRARHQSLRGKALRLITGFVGDALADMETRHFYIESFEGPTRDGRFSIIAKDALKFLDGDRAQAPVLSNGFLLAEIDEDDTEATLSPTGIGDDEYPFSGYVNLGGNEVVSFTRFETVPIGDNDIYTKILLHMNGADASTTFTDSNAGGSAHTWTANGNVQIDTAQSKFGGAAALFDGTGDYIATPDHADFALGSGPWTVDFWFRRSGTGNVGVFGQSTAIGSEASIALEITAGNVLRLYVGNGASAPQITGSTAITDSNWHHFAAAKSGTTVTMYLDGVSEGTLSNSSVHDATVDFHIGRFGTVNLVFAGWIDEFRLSVGIARWTSTFTPPTVEYTGSFIDVSTGDVLTIARAQLGTVASTHEAQDRAQLCLRFDAEDPDTIIADLIENYTDTPAEYIDAAAWRTEVENNLDRVYTATITEPTSVAKLVSELIEQGPFALWDDNVAQKLRLQVLRGIPTEAALFDHSSILKNSFDNSDQPDKRISRAQVYFGQIDPTKPLDNADNYRSVAEIIDTEAETIYGPVAFNVVKSRWIPAGGRTHAERVANLKLGRFRIAPRKFTFEVVRGEVVIGASAIVPELGNGYQLQWRTVQNPDGSQETVPIQIVRLLPTAAKFQVEAQEMRFTALDAADLANRIIVVDFNDNNLNWKTLHDALYPEIESGQTCTLIIAAGVIVGSTNISIPALDVGTWPAGVTLNLTLIGRIQGKGGNGATTVAAAQSGGTALHTREAINIDVDEGDIFGGGGGGGGAGAGGGGAGQLPGTGSSGGGGQNGTTEAGGVGGTAIESVIGGAGGGPGLAGGNGTGTGGAAGAAIDGVSFITVTQGPGDIRGGQIN